MKLFGVSAVAAQPMRIRMLLFFVINQLDDAVGMELGQNDLGERLPHLIEFSQAAEPLVLNTAQRITNGRPVC